MVTLIFTYRNRDIQIVKNCLDSLSQQTNEAFKVVLVNYGSNKTFHELINDLVDQYDYAGIINCETQGELWCKSRAINIALKQCETPYVFVGDVDMVFHPEFVDKLQRFKKKDVATYFQVGFLSQQESSKTKAFQDYTINFKSTNEATGMTFFNTKDLLEINGYDEFYKGWGAEDTDVHVRLEHAGKTVNFYELEVLLLHQWHPKHYRTKKSTEPFHSHLEQINHAYLDLTRQTKKIKANTEFDFGIYNVSDYESLVKPNSEYQLTNQTTLVKAFVNNVLLTEKNTVVRLHVYQDPNYKSLKQTIWKFLGRKTKLFSSMQDVNNLILENMIHKLRNSAYSYQYNQETQTVELIVKL